MEDVPMFPIRSHISPEIGIACGPRLSNGSHTICPCATARTNLARCPSSSGCVTLREKIAVQSCFAGCRVTSSTSNSGQPYATYIKRSMRPFHSSRRSLVRCSRYGSSTNLERNIDELTVWRKKKSSLTSLSGRCAALA